MESGSHSFAGARSSFRAEGVGLPCPSEVDFSAEGAGLLVEDELTVDFCVGLSCVGSAPGRVVVFLSADFFGDFGDSGSEEGVPSGFLGTGTLGSCCPEELHASCAELLAEVLSAELLVEVLSAPLSAGLTCG
jgi:hypothetical protein